jgi:hypothetical protein
LQAVYDEINAQRPDIVRHADTSRRSQKYRHNENVIASTPAMYRQVVVPASGLKEYVTGKDILHCVCVYMISGSHSGDDDKYRLLDVMPCSLLDFPFYPEDEVHCSKILVHFYQTTQCHSQEDDTLYYVHFCCTSFLNSCTSLWFLVFTL